MESPQENNDDDDVDRRAGEHKMFQCRSDEVSSKITQGDSEFELKFNRKKRKEIVSHFELCELTVASQRDFE